VNARELLWAPRARIAVGALVLCAAFGLKLAYSRAGADALSFVLVPSCWVATHVGGIPLVRELGAGFVSHRYRMIVGPACAGVNFLTIAWLALYFCCEARVTGARRKLAYATATLLVAYLATAVTNGVRIVLAARLHELQLGGAAASAHRLLGIVLYCGALLGLCRAAELALPGPGPRRPQLLPFGIYLAVALGVPLANRALFADPAHFLEHAAMTLGAGLAVVLVARLFRAGLDRLCSRELTP